MLYISFCRCHLLRNWVVLFIRLFPFLIKNLRLCHRTVGPTKHLYQ